MIFFYSGLESAKRVVDEKTRPKGGTEKGIKTKQSSLSKSKVAVKSNFSAAAISKKVNPIGEHQLLAIRKLFDKIDFKKDGFIDQDEISQHLSHMNRKESSTFFQKWVEERDFDNDGKVSFDDYLMYHLPLLSDNSHKSLVIDSLSLDEGISHSFALLKFKLGRVQLVKFCEQLLAHLEQVKNSKKMSTQSIFEPEIFLHGRITNYVDKFLVSLGLSHLPNDPKHYSAKDLSSENLIRASRLISNFIADLSEPQMIDIHSGTNLSYILNEIM